MTEMFEKLQAIEQKFELLTTRLGDPEELADREAYQKLSISHGGLDPIVSCFREY